ncbi:MAG: hypothetical protein HDR01_05785 [Lachnospiraceae bacterium]|nr:hypothetical protein [Lachnospiraceae bacterium]
MAQYDGIVRINTEINAKNAKIQLATLENKIVKTADKIASLHSKMESLKEAKIPTQEYIEVQKQIEATQKKLDILSERQERFVETGGKTNSYAYQRMLYDIAQLENSLKFAQGELQDLVDSGKAFTLGSDTQEYANLEQQLKYAENEMDVLSQKHDVQSLKVQKAEEEYKKLGSVAVNSLKKITSVVKSSAIKSMQMLGNAVKKAGASIKGIASKLLGIGKSSKSASAGIASMGIGFKNLLKYGLGIRSMYALINKFRTAVKEGFQNLAQYSTPVNSALSSLKSSLTQLKNSLATAFAPILTAVAPALTTLINLASRAATAVGMLIAALTGQKTFTKAKSVQEDYAKSLDGTAKSAKNANKQLSSLDKLNNLTTNDSGGGDGGGAGAGDMFEDVTIPDKFKDIAQWLKDMWDKADFTELGKALGEKLKNVLDNIPWDKIKETARKIGKSLATLINGFVEVDGLGESIGRTLAEAINTGFEFLNAFVHNLHWESIGKFIAETVNGFFTNIDWNLIYDTFITGAKGLGDAINTFVDYLDWEAIANSVSNFFNTFVDTVYTFVTTINWKELGEKVGKAISDAWTGIDWKKAGETVGEIFKAFFDFIGNAIENIDWWAVGETVKDFLIGIDWAGVAESFFEAVGAAIGGFAAFIGGLISDGVEEAKQYFQDKIDEAGGNVVEGIFNGIIEAVKNIGSWINEHIFQPFIEGFKKAFGIHSPSTVMAEMGTYIIQGLLDGITSLVDKVTETWQSMKEKALEIWEDIKTGLSEKWESMKETATTKWADIKENLSKKWEDMKENASKTFEDMKESISETWDGLWTNIKGVINSILGGVESMANGIVKAINTVISAMNGLHFDIPDWVPGVGGNTFGFNIPEIPNVSIPKLATGAVIPANREFLAVLGDQKHGTNIEAPLDTIVDAMKIALKNSGFSSGSGNEKITIEVPVILDNREIGRAVAKYDRDYFKRTGKPLLSY